MLHLTNNANETSQVAETLNDRMILASKAHSMLCIEALIQSQIASYKGYTVTPNQKNAECANILLSAPVRMINTSIYKALAAKYGVSCNLDGAMFFVTNNGEDLGAGFSKAAAHTSAKINLSK